MGQAKRRKAEIEKLKKHPKPDKHKNTTGVSNFRLYHGTTEPVARLISAGQGVQPRGDRPSMWQHAPSRPDCVYLTDLYGVKYASDIQTNILVHDEQIVRGAVVEVDMDKLNQANLLADEDFMAKMHMMTEPQREWTLEDFAELEKYYATNEQESAREGWRDCLLYYGTVAYRGVIPREAITRIALITLEWLGGLRYGDLHDEKLWEIHPNPTPPTHTRAQKFQAEITHHVFDLPDEHIEVITL
jgi:hypothetical protein